MFRFLRTIIVLTCLTVFFGSAYAVKKAKTTKQKAKQPVVEAVIAKPEVKIPEADILAEYTGGMITKQDLDKKISKLPAQSQSKFKTVEGQEQILDMMSVEDVFWQKAKDMNLLTDPVVLEKNTAARKQLMIQDYYKRNIPNQVKLSEADKQSFYNQNKKDFYVAPYITILYIQTADEPKARKVLDELRKGAPFDTVSARYTINTYAKGINGKIKNIRLNGNIPGVGNDAQLDSIIMANPVDTLKFLGPLKTITGWSVIKIMEKIEGRQRPYLECEAEIDQRLRPKKEAELLTQLMDKQKKQYAVVLDSTTLNLINLREPQKNAELEAKKVVSASDATLNMTVKSLLEKFGKMSPQEQMMYVKGGGALQMVNQELTRSLMYLDASKDKSYEDSLAVNENFKQTERYNVLQEAYKKLVVEAVKVTSKDARDYYDTHQEAYTTPAARKILVIWNKDEKSANKAQKKFIKAVKKNDAKTMNAFIQKYSIKPEQDTLDNIYRNGVITSIGSDQALSDLIWATPVGGISPVTKTTRNDILFFSVIEERPPFVKSFVETEPRIMSQLKKEQEKTQMETVKQQLFTQYNMKKYPEKLAIKLSADELFEMADNSSRQRKYKDSILYYDQIIKFYPNGKDDYKASFMKAFLVSEEMSSKEEGLKLFKDFLIKYKSGELNESAQYMVDELEGKHPPIEEMNAPEDNK
jgi:tetratricopeptide (TPR) repeat protein